MDQVEIDSIKQYISDRVGMSPMFTGEVVTKLVTYIELLEGRNKALVAIVKIDRDIQDLCPGSGSLTVRDAITILEHKKEE